MGKFTWGLIIVNVMVFLLVFSLPTELFDFVFELFSFSWEGKLDIWRWFTSLFLHASASHLFFNMVGLYFFGKILEEEDMSGKWFFSIYFITGLVGNFVFMLASPYPVVGASGAVFGLLGTAMLINPLKRVHLYMFPLPLGIIAITFIVFETLIVYFQPEEFANVANAAHIGGLLMGGLFAFIYEPKKAIMGVLVLVICVALLVFLGPVFSLMTGIGNLVLQVLDAVTGFFLYGTARLIGYLWI